jgi:hypothetical protein
VGPGFDPLTTQNINVTATHRQIDMLVGRCFYLRPNTQMDKFCGTLK